MIQTHRGSEVTGSVVPGGHVVPSVVSAKSYIGSIGDLRRIHVDTQSGSSIVALSTGHHVDGVIGFISQCSQRVQAAVGSFRYACFHIRMGAVSYVSYRGYRSYVINEELYGRRFSLVAKSVNSVHFYPNGTFVVKQSFQATTGSIPVLKQNMRSR